METEKTFVVPEMEHLYIGGKVSCEFFRHEVDVKGIKGTQMVEVLDIKINPVVNGQTLQVTAYLIMTEDGRRVGAALVNDILTEKSALLTCYATYLIKSDRNEEVKDLEEVKAMLGFTH